MPTHYETLGVKENATLAEIKKAYHKRALETHPDKFPPDKFDTNTISQKEDEFKQIEFAYNVLSDVQKCKEYNELLGRVPGFQRSGCAHTTTTKDVIDELFQAVLQGDTDTIIRLYTPERERQYLNKYLFDFLTLTFQKTILSPANQCAVIAALLEAGVDPNRMVFSRGFRTIKRNGISLAVIQNRPDILQVFLDNPRTNLHLKDKHSEQTALEHAFEKYHLECIDKLLNKINPTTSDLNAMKVHTSFEKFYYMSQQDSEVSSGYCTHNKMPLIISVALRHHDKQYSAVEIITRLLNIGADVNQTCYDGLTALDHLMARRTYYDIWSENRPSHPAKITESFKAMVVLLIERGANVNHTYSFSYSDYPDTYKIFGSPLIDAVRFSDVESVKKFLNERICTPPTLQILNHAIAEIGIHRPNAQELQKLLTEYRTRHYLYVPKVFSYGYYVRREESAQHQFATWYETLPANRHEMWQRIKQLFTSFVAGVKDVLNVISACFFRKSENNVVNTTDSNINIEALPPFEPKIDAVVNPTTSTLANQQEQMLFSSEAGHKITANDLSEVSKYTTRKAPSITQRIRTACSIM